MRSGATLIHTLFHGLLVAANSTEIQHHLQGLILYMTMVGKTMIKLQSCCGGFEAWLCLEDWLQSFKINVCFFRELSTYFINIVLRMVLDLNKKVFSALFYLLVPFTFPVGIYLRI